MVAVDDSTLVAALVSGDPRGLDEAYRTYADQLFTYCRGLVHDPEMAADAVQDTFVVASQRAYRLSKPEWLRAWLYAAARNECLRALRGRPRPGSPPEPAPEDTLAVDPVTGLTTAEIEELVWAAAESISRRDREVFELAVRHDLPAAEIEAVLGVSSSEVHARLTRARAQLKQGLGALMVARTGTQDCLDLAELLDDWDGRLTPPIRKQVLRHMESCHVCTERRGRKLRPSLLVSAYAAASHLPVPDLLWSRVELNCFDPGFAPKRGAIVRRAGRSHSKTGFPRPLDARRRRRVAVAGVAAVAAALLAAGTGAVIPATTDEQPDPPAAGPPASPSASPGAASGASPGAAAGAAPGAARRGTGAPSPTGSPSPTTEPESPSGPPPPARTSAPLTVEAGADVDCRIGGLLGYTVEVTATASQRLDAATLFVVTDSERRSFEMAVDGSEASAETDLMADREFEWQVAVTSGGRQAAETEPDRVTGPCS